MKSMEDSHEHDEEQREPYEAPRVLEDSPLETMSLACGKGGTCRTGGHAS